MSARTGDTDSQIEFWRGAFGDEYAERNALDPAALRSRLAMWARVLAPLAGREPASVLEVGANIGINLAALRHLLPSTLYALEPNDKARRRLIETGIVPAERAIGGGAQAIELGDGSVDLVFTSGVLIHIAPDHLDAACAEMHRISKRYIACIEYFADQPTEVPYRGHSGKLFKRDFGALWLDRFPTLRLVDYGFFWRRVTGLDNLTWWLFEKPSP